MSSSEDTSPTYRAHPTTLLFSSLWALTRNNPTVGLPPESHSLAPRQAPEEGDQRRSTGSLSRLSPSRVSPELNHLPSRRLLCAMTTMMETYSCGN